MVRLRIAPISPWWWILHSLPTFSYGEKKRNLLIATMKVLNPKDSFYICFFFFRSTTYESKYSKNWMYHCNIQIRMFTQDVTCHIISFYLGVSKNRGTSKSSILIWFSIINHPFWGFSPYFWKHPFLSFHQTKPQLVEGLVEVLALAASSCALDPAPRGYSAWRIVMGWRCQWGFNMLYPP